MNFELHLEWKEGKRSFSQHFSPELLREAQGLKVYWDDLASGERSRTIKIRLVPGKKIVLQKCYLIGKVIGGTPAKFMSNGYQSWTTTKELYAKEKIAGVSPLLYPLTHQNGDYSFSPGGDDQSWTYTFLRWNAGHDNIFFVGSLNENFAFTHFQYQFLNHQLIVSKDVKNLEIDREEVIFNLLLGQGPEASLWGEYGKHFVGENHQKPRASGWTSWYYYYTRVSESIVLDNLEQYKKHKIPADFFQIDDGYQMAVGDWTQVNEKFPRGLKFLADEIKNAGYRPGLWLAPMVCEKKSQIFQKHRDWLVKDAQGKLVKASYNPVWKSWLYPLDIEHPGVRQYLRDVFYTVLHDWGFELVKLDFLFAACFTPRPHKSRGKLMAETLQFLREIVGDKLMLGCGVPLGSGFKLFDYCRIGSDVAEVWDISFLKLMGVRERLSTANSLVSTIARWPLNGRMFVNDPDVFILRKKGQYLSPEERGTLFLANNIFGGLLFCSDHLGEYSDDILQQFLSMYPVPKHVDILSVTSQNELYHVKFRVGGGTYEAYLNLRENKVKIELDCGHCHEYGHLHHREIELKKHQSICFLKDYVSLSSELFLRGASDHLFPGATMTIAGQAGEYTVHSSARKSNVRVWLEYQGMLKEIRINGRNYKVSADTTPLQIDLLSGQALLE